MGRQKNLENMSQNEKIEHWAKVREKDAVDREELIAQMEESKPHMLESIKQLINIADDVAEDLQMDGVDNISVRQMHELMDAARETRNLFNV